MSEREQPVVVPVSRQRVAVPALRERLRVSLTAAMKARDRVAVSALRGALAAIDNAGSVNIVVHKGLSIEESPVMGTTGWASPTGPPKRASAPPC
jgi:hypothetical protein